MSKNLEFQSDISTASDRNVAALLDKSEVETSSESNNTTNVDKFVSSNNDNDNSTKNNSDSNSLTDDTKNAKIGSAESSSSGSIHAESVDDNQEFVEANSSFEHDDEERLAFKDVDDGTIEQQRTVSNVTLQSSPILNKIEETAEVTTEASQTDKISADKNISILTKELVNELNDSGLKNKNIVANPNCEINVSSNQYQTEILNQDDDVQFTEKRRIAPTEISNKTQVKEDLKTNRNQNDVDELLNDKVETEENETEYDEDEEEDEDELNDGLDDDENKDNPAYIPRGGQFYMHDLRANDDVGNTTTSGGSSSGGAVDDEGTGDVIIAQIGEKKETVSGAQIFNQTDVGIRQRISRADRKWEHDLYDDRLQRPKTTKELVRIYGKDIRKDELLQYKTTDKPKLKANVSKGAKENVTGENSVESNSEDDESDTASFNEKRRTRSSILRQQPLKSKIVACRRKTRSDSIRGEQRRILQTTANDRRRQRRPSSNQFRAGNYINSYNSGQMCDASNEQEIRKLPLRPVTQQQKQGRNGFRRTITSTRYSTQAINTNNARRQTSENYRRQAPSNRYEYQNRKELPTPSDEYDAVNEAIVSTTGGNMAPPRQLGMTTSTASGRGGGKRYTTQRHGQMQANFTASSSATQKYPDVHTQSQQRAIPISQNQFKHNYKTLYHHDGNHTRGRKYIQNRKDYGSYSKQECCYAQPQYHHHPIGAEMLEPIQNNYQHPPPILTQHNRSYMENYPPLGAQALPVNYYQQPLQIVPQIYLHSSNNQNLRQPTDTVYFDTTRQQQQGGNVINSVSIANSRGNQTREKRQLRIAEPGK